MKKFIHRLLSSFGIHISKLSPESLSIIQIVKILQSNNINVVFDIGANTGQFARNIRRFGYKGKIISFEPLPEAHKKLIYNSKKDPNWLIHQRCAIGDKCAEIEINVAANSESSSILPMLDAHESAAPHARYIRKEKTQIITFDSIRPLYADINDKFFLKIDTQGYESKVLDGAEETLKYCTGLIIEMSLIELYEGQILWQRVISRLESLGFLLFALQNAFVNLNNGQTLQVDGIFLKKTFEENHK